MQSADFAWELSIDSQDALARLSRLVEEQGFQLVGPAEEFRVSRPLRRRVVVDRWGGDLTDRRAF